MCCASVSLITLFSLIFYLELTDYSLISQRGLELTMTKSLLGLFFHCFATCITSLKKPAFSTDFPRCIARQGHFDLSHQQCCPEAPSWCQTHSITADLRGWTGSHGAESWLPHPSHEELKVPVSGIRACEVWAPASNASQINTFDPWTPGWGEQSQLLVTLSL